MNVSHPISSIIGMNFLVLALCVLSVTAAPTTSDIGLTQICIFLPIVLSAVLFFGFYLMIGIDDRKDSLIYARFLAIESKDK